VEARQDRGAKFLVPSDLGIGLVDGYNQIGFDRSLTKPHLRREVSMLLNLVLSGYSLMIRSPFIRRSIECK
jgi:DNA topoisomerase-3